MPWRRASRLIADLTGREFAGPCQGLFGNTLRFLEGSDRTHAPRVRLDPRLQRDLLMQVAPERPDRLGSRSAHRARALECFDAVAQLGKATSAISSALPLTSSGKHKSSDDARNPDGETEGSPVHGLPDAFRQDASPLRWLHALAAHCSKMPSRNRSNVPTAPSTAGAVTTEASSFAARGVFSLPLQMRRTIHVVRPAPMKPRKSQQRITPTATMLCAVTNTDVNVGTSAQGLGSARA
jgi:hypothetical protein